MVWLWFVVSLFTTPGLSEEINQTQALSKHKGFMVFLNWYYNEEAPYLVTKHFRKVLQKGEWQVYHGAYGAFHNVEVGVCQGRITEVLAVSKPVAGGMDPFLKTWLEDRLYSKVAMKRDTDEESAFRIADPSPAASCAHLADSELDSHIKTKAL